MEERIENGTQARISESGLRFLESTAPGLITDMMGGSLTFEIPPSCDAADIDLIGTIDVCGTGSPSNCTPDNPPCTVALEILGISLTPNDPPGNELAVEARINVSTPTPIKIHDGINCDVMLNTANGSRDHARVQTTITMNPDSGSKRLILGVGELAIPDGDIENDDISITGGFMCWVVNTFAKGMIIDQLTSQINDLAGPMVEENLCMACDQGELCPTMSTCDGEYCQEDSGEGCVMPFGMEGRMDLGGMLGSFAPGKQADLDLHLWAGGYAKTNNAGVSIGVLTGARTPERSECVPQRDPPDLTPAPYSDAFSGNTRPADDVPFHVGIGIHKKFLDAAGYAAYDSGLLCLDVGPREVAQLTTGTFQLLAGSILELTHDEEAPVVLSVRPQNPLYFTLSEPVVTQDPGTGEYEIETPLMTVRSQDFALDFYVFMDYRFIRAFRLLADLAIPVALVVNSQNQLVPVLGDLTDAFENLRVVESSLLEEDPATMATLFPSILSIAAGFIGDLGAIDLPDLQGFQLVLDDGSITSVDNDTLLAIYANLAYSAPSPKGGQFSVATMADIVERHVPPAGSRIGTMEEYRERGPAVTLALSGEAPDDSSAPLEWQYRVNGGFWSLFTDSPVVFLRRPDFLLQGRHRIEVRGRVKGSPRTLDPEPATLEFLVDTGAPKLEVLREGQTVAWQGWDNLTEPGSLEYSISLAGGPFVPWTGPGTSLELPEGFAGAVKVRVRDEAGNETVAGERILGLYGRITVPPSESSCGSCSQQDQPSGLLWLAFGLLGFLWIRRRGQGAERGRARGRGLPFALAFVLAAGGGANCDCGKKPHGDNPCPDAGVDFVCSNLELVCYPGQEKLPAEPIVVNPETCEPEPVVCECVGDASDVDPGDYGRFLSIDVHDGSPVVSCYSDRWGDLVVVTLDGSALVPESVDGVPGNLPTLDPEGYRGGVTARGDDVGIFTSAKIDSEGTVHVSYVSKENGALRYARGTPGDWEVHEVEAPSGDDAETFYTALMLDGTDKPSIAFMVTGLPDASTPGGFVSQLRYAVAEDSSPGGSSDWTFGVVDEIPIPCAGLCDGGQVCVAETWLCAAEEDSCGACGEGTGCVGGACVDILTAARFIDHPEGVGLHVSGGRLSTGVPVLAYHDRTFGLLRMAVGSDTGDASGWTATILEGDAYTDIGLYSSLAVDPSDLLHITYTDAVRDELLYLQADSTGAVLLREVVDPGIRPVGGPAEARHVVGLDSKVFIDAGGALRVIYQDGTTADLWNAIRNGDADWTLTPLLEGGPGYGFFVDVAMDGDGTLWAAQYVYDQSTPVIGHLEIWRL
jgi:hypothetical protein